MKVLGIDQSYKSCALVVIQDGKVVHLEKVTGDSEKDRYDQAADIAQHILNFCRQQQPNRIGIEGLAFASMGNMTRDLGGLLFSIVNALRQWGFRNKVEVIPATTIKKFATDYGRAKKEQLYEALPRDVKDLITEHGFKKTTGMYDATDAYWIARYREENN